MNGFNKRNQSQYFIEEEIDERYNLTRACLLVDTVLMSSSDIISCYPPPPPSSPSRYVRECFGRGAVHDLVQQAHIGFLIHGISLLSTQGKEQAMIEDWHASLEWLGKVGIVFDSERRFSRRVDTRLQKLREQRAQGQRGDGGTIGAAAKGG